MNGCVHVIGKEDFATDAIRLQEAIDKSSFTTSDMMQAVVYLSGKFHLNRTITIGDVSNDRKRPVSLIGIDQACLHYYGDITDAPVLTISGLGHGRMPRLEKVVVNANHRASCVLFNEQQNQCLARDSYFIYGRGVSVDAPQSYGSSFENCQWHDCHGIAYRSTSGNMTLSNVRFGQCKTEGAKATCVIETGPQWWVNVMWEGCENDGAALLWTMGPHFHLRAGRSEGNASDEGFVFDGGNGSSTGYCCVIDGLHCAEYRMCDAVVTLR